MAAATDPIGPLPAGQDRAALVAEVARALHAVPDGACVLVALSGGPDSTALAYLTGEARPDLTVLLGHVRHGLRPDDADQEVVAWHASALGVPLVVVEVDVQPSGEGLQAAARSARYAALRRVAREHAAGWILVGHTADDQAETVLLRLARGTGASGLGAMAPVRGDLVRPLLRLRRGDVHRFVLHEGLRCVTDPTNRDPASRRVRARRDVLPALGELGPDPVGALARLADLARDDAALLDALTADLAAEAVVAYGPTRSLPTRTVDGLEPALARRVVRAAVVDVRGGDPPSAAEVERVLTLADPGALDLPGVRVTRGAGWLAFAPAELRPLEPVELAVPGRATWAPLRTELVASTPAGTPTVTPHVQLALVLGGTWTPPDLPAPSGTLPPGAVDGLSQVVFGELGGGTRLTVRPRRAGDRVRTRSGDRKLKDVLIDRGVPRALRDLVPVVVLGDRVLWVPGVVADEVARIAGETAPALHLGLVAPGGP